MFSNDAHEDKENQPIWANQYSDPFFSRLDIIGDFSQLTELLENAIKRNDEMPIIFNFCYFLASRTLDISALSDVMVQIVEKYSKHNLCIIYQNPDLHQLHENWEVLKKNLTGFRSRIIESSIQWFCYDSLITNSLHNTKVYNDILYNDSIRLKEDQLWNN